MYLARIKSVQTLIISFLSQTSHIYRYCTQSSRFVLSFKVKSCNKCYFSLNQYSSIFISPWSKLFCWRTFIGRTQVWDSCVQANFIFTRVGYIVQRSFSQRVCAFKHTNIGSCSFWKVASREAANTALGSWSDEQSKQQKTVTLFQYYDTHSPTQVHININS